MPNWPVSFVDGSIQVADADGTHYPIFMQGVPVREFNPGWNAVGLQTGLAPFHVLELTNESGAEALWMLDTALEFRSNAVAGLGEADLRLYLGHVEPLVRNLFQEAVLAPHAAIPSAAHEFDGFRDSSIAELIRLPAANAVGAPDIVSVPPLATLGGAYTRNGVTLPAGWVEAALQATAASGAGVPGAASIPGAAGVMVPTPGGAMLTAQETLALPAHAGYRFHDRASGLVFYLLVGADALDRHLYVPQANAVFTAGEVGVAAAHDPLAMLLLYYATHTNRAVMLPEADSLQPVPAPMAAAPVAEPEPPPPPPPPPAIEPAVEPVVEPARPAVPEQPEAWMTPPAHDGFGQDGGGPVPVGAAPPRAPDAAPAGNWWQRLLGLGRT